MRVRYERKQERIKIFSWCTSWIKSTCRSKRSNFEGWNAIWRIKLKVFNLLVCGASSIDETFFFSTMKSFFSKFYFYFNIILDIFPVFLTFSCMALRVWSQTAAGKGRVVLALPSFHRLILNMSVVHNNTFNNKELNKTLTAHRSLFILHTAIRVRPSSISYAASSRFSPRRVLLPSAGPSQLSG